MLQKQMNCSFSDDIDAYAETLTSDHDIGTDFSLLIQGVLISLLLYMIVKQIPKVGTGLISGTTSFDQQCRELKWRYDDLERRYQKLQEHAKQLTDILDRMSQTQGR